MCVMTGHVYVVRADLNRVACDAVMPSCDDALNISDTWRQLLPPGLPVGDAQTWLRLPEEHSDGRVVRLPHVGDGPRVVPVVAIRNHAENTPSTVADAMAEGVRRVAGELRAGGGRAVPLVAMNLAGSGDGGLGGQRGELIDLLLPALRVAARDSDVDVALALRDPRDVAAAQVRRGDDDWAGLSSDLLETADVLGRRAAAGELSIFVGAGVSKPVGLPDWGQLIDALARAAGVDLASSEGAEPDKAAALSTIMGREAYHRVLQQQLGASRHALGHALLAGLGVRQSVTTNFDRCLELALDAVHGENGYRVLTRTLVEGGKPWLLKLHGDIKRPESLVFTRTEYDQQRTEQRAVRGVVQSLMLTSHLLFVGFGMQDENFLDLAKAVTKVRAEAEGAQHAFAGTVLTLTDQQRRHVLRRDLEFHAMIQGGDIPTAARVLEMFLDRLAWRAATEHDLAGSYLLDHRFDGGLSDDDRALRDALLHMVATLPSAARTSLAWPRVHRALADLGSVGSAAAAQGHERRASVPRPISTSAVTPSPLHQGAHFSHPAHLEAALRTWIERTSESTISAGRSASRRFLTVDIEGIACVLAGDTTRDGVRAFLDLEQRALPYTVIADSRGVPRRVAFGPGAQRVPGFYLYTAEPWCEPRVLHSRFGMQQKILDAVGVLHRRGYQQVRILPGMSGSGMHWRVTTSTVSSFSLLHGHLQVSDHRASILYTTADGRSFVSTELTAASSTDDVADVILGGLPELGPPAADWAYAGWYTGLLGLVQRHDALPIAYADYFEDGEGWEIGWGSGVRYPHPPKGPRQAGGSA